MMQTIWTSAKNPLTYCIILLLPFSSAIFLSGEDIEPVPKVAIEALPQLEIVPDFASIFDVQEKKQSFFNFMEPYVDDINEEIIQQRFRIFDIRDKIKIYQKLSAVDLGLLSTLSKQYELETGDLTSLDFLTNLLRRVDKIPVSLALAQAANESGWGTSRFAREGKNFFGQWCYTDGCGIIPTRRMAGANHEVRRFESVKDSVQAYIHNLNTFSSYQMLRRIRQQLRSQNTAVDGISLSDGLLSYSARGDDYIDEVQTIIFTNNLLARDNPTQ